MARLVIKVAFVLLACGVASSGLDPGDEIDRVAALARVYGVARYFYPGDGAAALDWNRFAVYAVKRARAAADPEALQDVLRELFDALGPGIEIGFRLRSRAAAGKPNPSLVAWRYLGPGFGGFSTSSPYVGKRTHRPVAASATISGFVTMMQAIPAEALRGKTIRLRGRVRAKTLDMNGQAALWLRVDRPNNPRGFFDNMGDRPVRSPEWAEYTIVGPVAEDASGIAFGAMAAGPVEADFDAIDLSVRSDSDWMSIPINDAGFEATGATRGWSRAGTGNASITRLAGEAPEGRQFLRIAPSPGPVFANDLFDGAPPVDGASVDVDLGLGLHARIPLALTAEDAGVDAFRLNQLDRVRAALDAALVADEAPSLDVRLADVVVAWNAFRHFYPYWPESGSDWDARLRPQLHGAYATSSRNTHRDALRHLVADARDGHGGVVDRRAVDQFARLPVQVRAIGNQLVITATAVPSMAPVGAIVAEIDGVRMAERMAQLLTLASGTAQWKQVRAAQEMTTCPKGSEVTVVLDDGTGARERRLPCNAMQIPQEQRPERIAAMADGVWYVDLSRASAGDVTAALEKLAAAAGVIFDVRGYPTDSGSQLLPHLLDAPETDRWMHVAKIVGPFGEVAGWQSAGWDLRPAPPRLRGKVVFLTDARAISYAESVMGYVSDRKLGTIVGSPTAGTNGNVVTFTVPSGFSIAFTGMRVTRHDGHTRRGTWPALLPTFRWNPRSQVCAPAATKSSNERWRS